MCHPQTVTAGKIFLHPNHRWGGVWRGSRIYGEAVISSSIIKPSYPGQEWSCCYLQFLAFILGQQAGKLSSRYHIVSVPERLRFYGCWTYYSGFILRGEDTWVQKGCVFARGAEDSIGILIIVKGRRGMMQTDERMFLPCEEYQEPLSDSHINDLLGWKRLVISALSIGPHALKILLQQQPRLAHWHTVVLLTPARSHPIELIQRINLVPKLCVISAMSTPNPGKRISPLKLII